MDVSTGDTGSGAHRLEVPVSVAGRESKAAVDWEYGIGSGTLQHHI
jgi:hypothetical protein